MNYTYIILIALALGIDAFAVSFSAGAFFGKSTGRQKFRLSFHFGLFQFFMPIIGWAAGKSIVDYISVYDHWIAFAILLLIGGKMIYDSLTGGEELIDKDISKGLTLISLSLATSIDALAVGFSLGIIDGFIFIPSLIIGIVAATMSLIGIKLGEKMSELFGNKIAIFGGIVLIAIGLHIVLEHLELV